VGHEANFKADQNNMATHNNNSKGRLIAADFLTHTVKAFLIGVAASFVLGGAVILLAQSNGGNDAALNGETPASKESP